MPVRFGAHLGRTAVFDARAFVMPLADVPNYFVWRAKDEERNSLNMLCHAHFGHGELHGKSRAPGGTDTRSDVLPMYPSIAQAMGVQDAAV